MNTVKTVEEFLKHRRNTDPDASTFHVRDFAHWFADTGAGLHPEGGWIAATGNKVNRKLVARCSYALQAYWQEQGRSDTAFVIDCSGFGRESLWTYRDASQADAQEATRNRLRKALEVQLVNALDRSVIPVIKRYAGIEAATSVEGDMDDLVELAVGSIMDRIKQPAGEGS